MSKKIRINPKNPKYQGCYQHTTKKGLVVYWVKKQINGKTWQKVGSSHDGITPAYVKQFHGALTTENIHHILPTKHRRLDKEKAVIPTVDEAWEEHYKPWANRSRKPKTNKVAFNRYDKHIKPYVGDTRLDQLTVAQLDKLKDRWTKSRLQLPTQQQVWLVITSFINIMKALDVFDATAALMLPKKINAKRRRERFLDESQIEDLLMAINKHDKVTWYQCCIIAYAGLRTDEVLRLRPMDIKLDEGRIRIPDSKSATNQTKSGWVSIDEILEPILKE